MASRWAVRCVAYPDVFRATLRGGLLHEELQNRGLGRSQLKTNPNILSNYSDIFNGLSLKKHEFQTERQKPVIEAESTSAKGFEPLKREIAF